MSGERLRIRCDGERSLSLVWYHLRDPQQQRCSYGQAQVLKSLRQKEQQALLRVSTQSQRNFEVCHIPAWGTALNLM
jgi:hypothetical protein